MTLGAGFVGIKMYEWHHEYEEHLVPGEGFGRDAEGKYILKYVGGPNDGKPMPPEVGRLMEMYFVFYFIITVLHALHLLIGLGVLAVQLILVWRRSLGIPDYTPIEVSGLYWHFVDIVWIFVFPLLYLLRQ